MTEKPPGAAGSRAYFVRNAGGTRPPFYYLHGDFTGGGLYCLALAGHLGPDQPLVALNPHGRNGAPLPADLESMAVEQLATLRALAPRGPYRLGGHCNGGLIAYAMARRLAAAGETVERLVLISVHADNSHLFRPGDRGRRLHYYAARARALAAMSAAERWTALRHAVRTRLAAWAGRREPDGAALAAVGGMGPATASPLLAAYRRLMVRHAPGAYGGPVTLLWPEEVPTLPGEDATHGWARVAPRVRVVTVPGGHHTCFTEHAAAVARVLRACLDAAEP